jgi:hypothetical protein
MLHHAHAREERLKAVSIMRMRQRCITRTRARSGR